LCGTNIRHILLLSILYLRLFPNQLIDCMIILFPLLCFQKKPLNIAQSHNNRNLPDTFLISSRRPKEKSQYEIKIFFLFLHPPIKKAFTIGF